MTLLIIDHHDSFVLNLANWFQYYYKKQTIVLSYSDLPDHFNKIKKKINGVVFSPGPGLPEHYVRSLNFYGQIPADIPILGVCLGHQLLLNYWGATLEKILKVPCHGVQISHRQDIKPRFFPSTKLDGPVVFFNSWVVKSNDNVFKHSFDSLWSRHGYCLMAEHKFRPQVTVQFHPESFASPAGHSILKMFLKAVHK